MSALTNLLVPPVLFFGLGLLARLIRSDLRIPPDLAKILSIYLLVAIGLHGGIELGKANLLTALLAVLWALVLGLSLPLLAFGLLRLGRVDPLNAAAIAAHYGSVSAGTFLTAIAYLQNQGIEYEQYPLIMLAVMESPAIVLGLLLAAFTRKRMAQGGAGQRLGLGKTLHEALTNGSVVLLLGSMGIGAVISPKSIAALHAFTSEIFMGMLCLFLLEMGMEAGSRLGEFRRVGWVLVLFGLSMPLIGGVLGAAIGHYGLGFGIGGTTLVAVLAASASYIAVPPAMRLAIPEANPSFYLTLALGVTFPFNVVVGIPLYHRLAEWLATQAPWG